MRDRAEREVERRAEDVTSRAVNSILDEMEDAVVCVATDPECISEAEENGDPVVVTDEEGEVVEVRDGDEPGEAAAAVEAAGVETEVAESSPARPGEGTWANYDFVPGNRVLFATNFENETIGRFPQQLEFLGGMMQLVEWEGRTLLESTNLESHIRIPLSETLPERFTIEFDAYISARRLGMQIGVFMASISQPRSFSRHGQSYFVLGRSESGVGGPNESLRSVTAYRDEITPIRIAVDDTYGTVYVNEQRVANMPVLQIERNDFIEIVIGGRSDAPAYISNIRVAAGGKQLYDRLMADGRVSTQGIYFDTGSDTIRPESTGTLTEIGRMLAENPDLRIRIEGHTDNVGDPEMNRALSDRRANSVMTYLMSEHGIDTDRLEAVGMGENEPMTDNDTEEGRQNNRRVELVRL
ncbi:MAG: OmpA family protein [Longimonas sp.]|uniref:OmpA family protein n=1 Tax=Longimonas sp. TaxID=2039626 RepID=UPI0039751DC0